MTTQQDISCVKHMFYTCQDTCKTHGIYTCKQIKSGYSPTHVNFHMENCTCRTRVNSHMENTWKTVNWKNTCSKHMEEHFQCLTQFPAVAWLPLRGLFYFCIQPVCKWYHLCVLGIFLFKLILSDSQFLCLWLRIDQDLFAVQSTSIKSRMVGWMQHPPDTTTYDVQWYMFNTW